MGCCSSKPQVVTPLPVKPPPPTPTPTPSSPARTPSPPARTPSPPARTPPPKTKPDDVQFSSDCVTKQIDERRDEHPIQSTEDDYPDPAPPQTDEDECRPKNRWFKDDDYENGSDEVVDLHEIEVTDDSRGLTLQNRGRGNINQRRLPTISYTDIDENAKKVDAKLSFERLMTQLTQPITDDTNRELLTARAIITWLANQDIDHVTYGAGSLETPAGMLQLLKENRMTYATCYTRLCRKAGLQCTLVKGLVKAAGYEPGKTHAPITHWTAVFAAGNWRLVHPFWICRALFGHNLGGWVKIEQDGTSVEKREKASAGVVRSTFQEHYFMPRPQHFIYECYAEDPQWQLLPDDVMVRSQRDFLEMPYLLPPFFGLALELVTEHKCSLETNNGRCKIVLKAKPWNAHMLVLRYELFARVVSNEKLQKDKRASRMVFNSRANELFEFDIRFPAPGKYKFIIYGGPFKSPALRLCEFQIVCNAAMNPFVLLPLSCEDIGWGPGPKSVEAGLLVPTRVGGFVNVPKKRPRRADIQFQIHPDMINNNKYGANLHRQSDGETGSDEYVECQIMERCLVITVTLPSDEEFGLAITCSTISIGGIISETKTVCNYLLCTANQRRTRTDVRIARDRLMNALDSDIEPLPRKVEDIQSHIDNCRKKKIDELDEDFCAAKTRFEYLFYKNELRDAILRDNYHVAARTLKRLDRYKYKAALQRETRKVQALLQALTERRGTTQNMNT